MKIHDRFEEMLEKISDSLDQLAKVSVEGGYTSLQHLSVMAEAKGFQQAVIESNELSEEYKKAMLDRLLNEFKLCDLDLS